MKRIHIAAFVVCALVWTAREEAIAKAKAALVDRLARGEIITIDVENDSMSSANVWREEAARFRNDPTFDEFVNETQSERHNLDSEDPAS